MDKKAVKRLPSPGAQTKDDTYRRLISELSTAPTFIRNVVRELSQLMQPNNTREMNNDGGYVKKEDMEDVVSKLILCNSVGQNLSIVQEKNTRLYLMILNLSNELMMLNKRVDELASSLQEIRQSDKHRQEDDKSGTKPHKFSKSSQRRMSAEVYEDWKLPESYILPKINTLHNENENGSNCSPHSEVIRASNKPRASHMVHKASTFMELPTVKKQAAPPATSCRTAAAHEAKLDHKRREEQRRRLEAIMRMYRNSRHIGLMRNFDKFKFSWK